MAFGMSDYGDGWGGGFNRARPDYLLNLRNMMMSDALSQGQGARAAAQRSAGDDPSMASAYGLAALLRGQSNASRSVAQGRLQWMLERQRLLNQMRLMEKQAQLQRGNPLMGALGSLGGGVIGSWLSPGGWFKGTGE